LLYNTVGLLEETGFQTRTILLAKRRGNFKIMGMEDSQLTQYVPVLILGLVALAFSAGTLIASVLVGKLGKRSRIKDTAYECGMLPIGDGSSRLSVKFYLVAMLFILFDIEWCFFIHGRWFTRKCSSIMRR